jgi:hypothetical protein
MWRLNLPKLPIRIRCLDGLLLRPVRVSRAFSQDRKGRESERGVGAVVLRPIWSCEHSLETLVGRGSVLVLRASWNLFLAFKQLYFFL